MGKGKDDPNCTTSSQSMNAAVMYNMPSSEDNDEPTTALLDTMARPAGNGRSAGESVRAVLSAVGMDVDGSDSEIPSPEEQSKAKRAKRRGNKDALDPITRPNGDQYFPRAIEDGDGFTDVEMLRAVNGANMDILLRGYPGCGKTAMAEAAFGDKLVTIVGANDMETSDLIGGYNVKPDGSYEWIDGPLVVAMKEGRPLLVDEITLIPAGVLSYLYPVMDGRGVVEVPGRDPRTVEAKKGFSVIGAYNPDAPDGVEAEALLSRFDVKRTVDSDLAMTAKAGVERKIIRWAQNIKTQREQNVSAQYEDAADLTWAAETRDLLSFQKIKELFGINFAISNMIENAPQEERKIIRESLENAFKERGE